jgi:antitoxin component HigA of HigAB toxin-antitoxin module
MMEDLEQKIFRKAAKIIKSAMTDAGVSAAQLARITRKSGSSVSKMLSGSQNMTLKTMVELLAACGKRLEMRSSW